MGNPGTWLESAADALIRGEVDEATRHLSLVEQRLGTMTPRDRADLQPRLDRLASLAQATALGIEDARKIIASAGTSARSVTTYDRCGDAQKVSMTKPVLGRY
ncbi:hypothetical protein [Paracoccus xiamenensis]|uniref:hypothetical protein n=1 Tax=Paracoccus xiamenensis TaxID=2714901 RepID=UPI00140AEF05|nr:hypothetical protein [Paracoccus xiamenensis]NHF73156.1 hypothetical protein [Paracoccus xiamenensis]